MRYKLSKNVIEKIVLCCFIFLISVFCSANAQTRVEIKPGLFYTCTGNNITVEEDESSSFTISVFFDYSANEDQSYYLVSCNNWQKQVDKSKLKQTIKEAILVSSSTTGNTLACRFANLLAADFYNNTILYYQTQQQP